MRLFIKYRTALFLFLLSAGILVKKYFNTGDLTIILALAPLIIAIIKYPGLYFILFFPLGFFLVPDYLPNPDIEEFTGMKISASGTLIKNPELRENSTRLFIRLNKINTVDTTLNVNSKIVAYLENTGHRLTYGDSIELRNIRLKRIKNFHNPGSFNIEQFYRLKDIFYSTYIGGKNITVSGKNAHINPFLYRVNLLRTEYSRFVNNSVSYPESAVINALTVGDKSNIPGHIREIFSGLGIAHIFAISGLHVGAIAVGFYFLIKWVLKRSEYVLLTFQMPKIAALLTIFPVFLYTALAGFSISSVRAFIMISIFLFSIVLGKDDLKLNTLFIAALVILLINPNSLFDLSFQLSFLSVFGILIIHSFYPLEIKTGLDKIKTALKTTVAATLITLPITVNTFGYFPVFSVPANLVLIPLVEFIIVPLGLISLIMFRISVPVSLFLLEIDKYFISILLGFTGWVDRLGLATVVFPRIHIKTTLFLIFTALLILLSKRYKKIYYLLPLAVVLSSLVCFNNFYKHESGNFEIDFLDSGNKNIALLKTPSGKTIMVNGGYSLRSESDFIERSVVNPYLLHNNITEIDHLVLSSLDNSHIKGAASLLKKIDVKNIWINGHKLKSSLWEQIYQKNINLHKIPEEDSSIQIDGLVLNLLRPFDYSVFDSKRPVPLLLEFIYDNHIFHIGEDVESAVFNNKRSNLIYIPGSTKTNYDSIIKKYRPGSLVCKNCSNDFSKRNMETYQTDSAGMVSVTIKNNNIIVKEYLEK